MKRCYLATGGSHRTQTEARDNKQQKTRPLLFDIAGITWQFCRFSAFYKTARSAGGAVDYRGKLILTPLSRWGGQKTPRAPSCPDARGMLMVCLLQLQPLFSLLQDEHDILTLDRGATKFLLQVTGKR